MTTVAGKTGGGFFSGDGGAATNASLYSPQQLAFDKSGNLFIADADNNRIRKVHFAGDPSLNLPNLNLTNTGTYGIVVTSPFGMVTSSNFTLTVLTTPAISPPVVNPDGSVTLNLSTTPNLSSRLSVTTNLTPPVVWQPVSTNPAGGYWQFTDTNASAQPAVFYRASTP
jgi:hypothetical protein